MVYNNVIDRLFIGIFPSFNEEEGVYDVKKPTESFIYREKYSVKGQGTV